MKPNFTRITDGKKIIPEIEGLRFVSILLVVVSHISNNTLRFYPKANQSIELSPLSVFLEECGAGVNIFFFISGFILAIPFLRQYVYHGEQVSLSRYYYRRLSRIEPPYIISLTIFLIFGMAFLHWPTMDSLQHFGASALYLHNILYDRISTINPVAWTLEIEIQFYLIFPLLAMVLFLKSQVKRRLLLSGLVFLGGILYAEYYSFFKEYNLSKSLFAYITLFITGCIAADIYLSNKEYFSRGRSFIFDILGMTALYIIITLAGFEAFGYRSFVFLSYVLLFISIFKGKFLNYCLTNKYVATIGGMCYSIYLTHYAVIFFITDVFTRRIFSFNYKEDIIIQTLINLPVILITSGLFFLFLERPFMDIQWPTKFMKFFKKKDFHLNLIYKNKPGSIRKEY